MDRTAITVALVGAAVSFTIGYLGHQRSKQVDATSAQSGVASHQQAGTAQILDGLNKLIDQLQEDNSDFRVDIRELTLRLEAVTKERDALKLEVARLRKKYADNGE